MRWWAFSISVATLVMLRGTALADDDEPGEQEQEEVEEEPPPTPQFLTPGQLECLARAKNQREVRECLPKEGDALVVRAAADFGAYTDTNAVDVLSPSISGGVASPTGGWGINGSYALDVVSAASPDIVSEASPKSRGEKRHSGTLGGQYKPGDVGVQAGTAFSAEPDYVSASGSLAGMIELDEKRITPRLAYELRHDTIGRGGTPFSVFHHTLLAHDVDFGVTLVLNPTTLLLVGASVGIESGDQSKPYRFIPMFSPGTHVTAGMSPDAVNAARLPIRPLEQLPLDRWRFATGARLAKRIAGESTLRIEERLYADSWGMQATTTDLRWLVDLGRRFRVWPHVRLNAQTAASFQKLAYVAQVDGRGNVALPLYRTGDRELARLVTATFGGGVRWALTDPNDKKQVGLTLQVETMQTRYFDVLYVQSRAALYGAIGVDMELR